MGLSCRLIEYIANGKPFVFKICMIFGEGREGREAKFLLVLQALAVRGRLTLLCAAA